MRNNKKLKRREREKTKQNYDILVPAYSRQNGVENQVARPSKFMKIQICKGPALKMNTLWNKRINKYERTTHKYTLKNQKPAKKHKVTPPRYLMAQIYTKGLECKNFMYIIIFLLESQYTCVVCQQKQKYKKKNDMLTSTEWEYAD